MMKDQKIRFDGVSILLSVLVFEDSCLPSMQVCLLCIESSTSGWAVGVADSSCCWSGFFRFDAKQYGFFDSFANFGFAPLIMELVCSIDKGVGLV